MQNEIDPQKAMYPFEVLTFSLVRSTCIKTKEMNIIEVFENRMLRCERFKRVVGTGF